MKALRYDILPGQLGLAQDDDGKWCRLADMEIAEARIAELEATIADVSKGSTHELVRYWLDKTIDLEKQVETLYDADTEDAARITKAKAVAQAWRDRAFGSQHMGKLKSDTLEECAAELDAALVEEPHQPGQPAAPTAALADPSPECDD